MIFNAQRLRMTLFINRFAAHFIAAGGLGHVKTFIGTVEKRFNGLVQLVHGDADGKREVDRLFVAPYL